ncbi:MAG TPA: response regulator [bacterium]|mgnify:CR=1 FL=1|nr:response regulator [bacterium]
MTIDAKQNYYIVVIDDDPVMRLSCIKILSKEGYQVESYEDGLQGLEQIHIKKPDLMVVDLKMPKISGMEVIARVHEIDSQICIVVITGYATIGTAVQAMKAGAYDFLPKPFTPDELRIIVERGIERTVLQRQSIELARKKEEMERRFITFVSHQLQSPLTAVQQYLQVLNHLKNSPEKEKLQQQWIERSISRINDLKDMVEDWLTISKVESGCIADACEQIDVLPLLQDVVSDYESFIREKKIRLRLSIPDRLARVWGHFDCLKIVFSNLIHNAIKYNKNRGKLTIRAAEDGEFVAITIADSGIGIPADKIQFLFQEFYRVRDESTKNISGTGLGLAICQKIINELNGKIEVQSKLNKGSAFKMKLPKYKGGSVD